LSEWFSYSASADGDRGFSGSEVSDTEEIYFQDIGGLSEADADGGSVDFGVFCVGDEYAETVTRPPSEVYSNTHLGNIQVNTKNRMLTIQRMQ